MNVKTQIQKTITILLVILALSMCLDTGLNTMLTASAASTPDNSTIDPAQDPVNEPAKVWTDKVDYHPNELVTIFGSGFTANTHVAFTVTKLEDNTTVNWSTDSDAFGNLTTTYQIDQQGAPFYRIDATDGQNHATNAFTDASITVTNTRTSVTKNAGETLYAMVGDGLTISASYSGWYAVTFETSPPEVWDNDNLHPVCFVPPTDGSGWHSAHGSIGPLSWTIPSTFDAGLPGTPVTPGNYLIGIWDDSMLIAEPYVNVIIGSSQVSQPITVTMANGAPSTTVTVNGGNPSPSTFSADGAQHTISIDSGASAR
jgi:hypothetical protein